MQSASSLAISKEQLKVELNKDSLIVYAEEAKNEDQKYIKREFNYGNFKKVYHIPEKVNKEKIESKGIKSIRSRVANISEFLDQEMSVEQFREAVLHSIFAGEENVRFWELTEEDWDNIHELSKERYANWDWNYGKSPKFNIKHSHRFPVGGIDVRLQVEKGLVQEAHIYGDFFGVGDVSEIEQAITGVKYERATLAEAIEGIDIPKLLGGITTEDFLKLIY